MDKIQNSKNILPVTGFVDGICEERNSRDTVFLKNEIRMGDSGSNLPLPAHKDQVPNKNITKRDLSEPGSLTPNGISDVKKVQKMMTNALDTYFTLENAPSNEYGIKYCRRLNINSVVNGLKKKWNGQVENGTLLQEELEARINGVNSVLNFVSNDGEALVKEFLNSFFGEDTGFYESWNDKFGVPEEAITGVSTTFSNEKYVKLEENFENFDVYLDDKSNVYQKDSKPNVGILYPAKKVDSDFEEYKFDDISGRMAREVEENVVKDFREVLGSTLQGLINSSTIREFLGLLIIGRKFFIGDNKWKVLFRENETDSGFDFCRDLSDKKMAACLEIGNFRKGQEQGLYNMNNLLIMLHEMGHFVFQTIISDCGGSLREEEGEWFKQDFCVFNNNINNFGSGITKGIIGLDDFGKKSAVSEQMVNELCDEVWSGEIVEPIQILGMCQYQDIVLLNSYGDFSLLKAVHEIKKDIKVHLRTAHNKMRVNDGGCDAKNNVDMLKIFFRGVENKISDDKVLIKNFLQKIINFLDKFGFPEELSRLPFDEINKMGESISTELNLPLTLLTAKIFYMYITIPVWSCEFKNFFANLFQIKLEDLEKYIKSFSANDNDDGAFFRTGWSSVPPALIDVEKAVDFLEDEFKKIAKAD